MSTPSPENGPKENGIQPCTYHALWKFHGTPAGPIRNRNQLLFSQPDLGIAFPGSRGTYNMWALLREHAVPRIRIDNDGNAVWYTGRADVAEASALAQRTICGHETV